MEFSHEQIYPDNIAEYIKNKNLVLLLGSSKKYNKFHLLFGYRHDNSIEITLDNSVFIGLICHTYNGQIIYYLCKFNKDDEEKILDRINKKKTTMVMKRPIQKLLKLNILQNLEKKIKKNSEIIETINNNFKEINLEHIENTYIKNIKSFNTDLFFHNISNLIDSDENREIIIDKYILNYSSVNITPENQYNEFVRMYNIQVDEDKYDLDKEEQKILNFLYNIAPENITMFDKIINSIKNEELKNIIIIQGTKQKNKVDKFNAESALHTKENIKEFISELYNEYNWYSELKNEHFIKRTNELKDKFNEAVVNNPTEKTLIDLLTENSQNTNEQQNYNLNPLIDMKLNLIDFPIFKFINSYGYHENVDYQNLPNVLQQIANKKNIRIITLEINENLTINLSSHINHIYEKRINSFSFFKKTYIIYIYIPDPIYFYQDADDEQFKTVLNAYLKYNIRQGQSHPQTPSQPQTPSPSQPQSQSQPQYNKKQTLKEYKINGNLKADIKKIIYDNNDILKYINEKLLEDIKKNYVDIKIQFEQLINNSNISYSDDVKFDKAKINFIPNNGTYKFNEKKESNCINLCFFISIAQHIRLESDIQESDNFIFEVIEKFNHPEKYGFQICKNMISFDRTTEKMRVFQHDLKEFLDGKNLSIIFFKSPIENGLIVPALTIGSPPKSVSEIVLIYNNTSSTHFELIQKNDYVRNIINNNLEKIKEYFKIAKERDL